MPPSRSITEIAAIIAENTAVVDEYFSSNGIPTPSFSVDGPARVRIPPTETKVAEAHATVLGATMELHNLMLGPEAMLMNINVGLHLACLLVCLFVFACLQLAFPHMYSVIYIYTYIYI